MKNKHSQAVWLLTAALALSSSAFASETTARYLIKFKNSPSRQSVIQALESRGFRFQRHIPELDLYVADGKKKLSFNALRLDELRASGLEIQYAERDARWHAVQVPNDPLYSQQNEVKRLDIENAWNVTTGSSDVLVAVSDTGISQDHPDLRDQIDPNGYNFVGGNTNVNDDNRHGTHVSGILGASGDNATGVAGVNWRVKILPVKFLDQNGSGTTEHGIDTLIYAANHGARVINCSWGGSANSNALRDAINYAFDHGALVMAAAGNNATNTDNQPEYPADFRVPGVLSVASSQSPGVLSSFSNFGARTAFFAAPGSDVLSTLPNGQYGRLSGTSMATPMATGVAALILSIAPQLTPLELRNALLNAVDERPTYSGKLATSGDLNARLAVQELSGGFQVWPGRITFGVGERFQFTAYHATGGVTWSSSNPGVATVDATGTLQGLKTGSTLITARDGAGQTASTQWVQVVAGGGSGGGGGGGCGGSRRTHSDVDFDDDTESAPWEEASAALSLGLPVLAASLVRRAGRHLK